MTASPARADRPRVPMRRVARLFGPYRRRLAVVFGCIIGSSLISLVSPFLLRAILDVALPRGRTGLLSLLAAGMLLVAVVTGVISVLQNYLSLTVGQRVMNDLRQAVYQHLQRMSLAFFTRTRTGEVQSRIVNDIGGMSQTVTTVATTVVGSVTTVAGSLVAMTMLDWQLTIVSLLTLPVFVWISRRVGSERRQISMERQKQLSLITSLLEESLSVNGFMLGRIMGRSAGRHDEFAAESQVLTDMIVRSNMAGRWRQSTVQITMAAMPVLIYLGRRPDRRAWPPRISIGGLVAFTSLQQGLFGPSSSSCRLASPCRARSRCSSGSLNTSTCRSTSPSQRTRCRWRARAGTSGSSASNSPTAANRPCAASTSTCHPAATSPSSGRPARARRRSATSCRACTT